MPRTQSRGAAVAAKPRKRRGKIVPPPAPIGDPAEDHHYVSPLIPAQRVESLLTDGHFEQLKVEALSATPALEPIIDQLGQAHLSLLNSIIADARQHRPIGSDAAAFERHVNALNRAIRTIKSNPKRYTVKHPFHRLIVIAEVERDWASGQMARRQFDRFRERAGINEPAVTDDQIKRRYKSPLCPRCKGETRVSSSGKMGSRTRTIRCLNQNCEHRFKCAKSAE
jgi:hypothetical protein